ncbi:MAG: Stp1/IreP family PP2C-type Ser/Thr phosphatase [Eubacteriaceae bacterium]|jgi:protein phosphatase|nr:Stp1/IreP family PP2C-type Ser/Thr phosphatase [Eubacteriaceae bacterium]
MNCAYSSHVGIQRKINQDACLAATIECHNQEYYIFAVADGLGGHRSGDVASNMAVDYIKQNACKMEDLFSQEELQDFVSEMNAEMLAYADTNQELAGMATTLTMAIVCGQDMCLVHIGDSRAYRVTEKDIEQLTKDHSLVQVLMDEGRISNQEALMHPQKNVITRALGTDKKIRTDYYRYTLQAEDTIMLCTDGLYNMVLEKRIQELIDQDDLEVSAKNLINEANDNGGTDNITVVLFTEKGASTDDQ